MTRDYVALVRKEEGADCWVDTPGILGCVSSGEMIEQTKANFREAIAFRVKGMDAVERERLPVLRPKAEVLAAEERPYIEDFIIEAGAACH